MGTVVVLAILAGVVALIVRKMIKDKKNGKRDYDRQGSVVAAQKTGFIASYREIIDGECCRHEPYRAKHETGGCFYGDS